MTWHTTRRLLWLGCGALGLAAVGAPVALVAWPVRVPVPAAPSPDAAPAAERAGPAVPEIDATRLARNLQRPLYDPKPVVVAAPEPPPPPEPTVALVGTVVEPGTSWAMLRTKAGQVKTVPVGEAVEGTEVVAVTADSVTIRFAGVTRTLTLQTEGGGR